MELRPQRLFIKLVVRVDDSQASPKGLEVFETHAVYVFDVDDVSRLGQGASRPQ